MQLGFEFHYSWKMGSREKKYEMYVVWNALFSASISPGTTSTRMCGLLLMDRWCPW
jgi:hypothetical protein